MCGRFGAFGTTPSLAERFEIESVQVPDDHPPSWNVAPSMDVRAVLERADLRRLVLLRWGLVPSWAEDPSVGNRLTNARAETVETKAAFSRALARRRCLVPADGFYEWARTENGTKRGGRQPWWFSRLDGDIVALGGLWETWRAPDGSVLRSVCLMTTAGNVDLEGVHDRMPVIVDPEHWDRWLDPDLREPSAVSDLLHPADHARLRRHAVDPRVNKTDIDGPELIEARPPAPEPLSLPLA